METKVNVTGWKFIPVPHEARFSATTAAELISSGFTPIDATVPGNAEPDLSRAGLLPEDLYAGDHIQEVREWEFTHFWYFANFTLENTADDVFLRFDGIDAAAEVFVDGQKVGDTENMFLTYEYPLDAYRPGTHEVVVHIIPALVYTQDKPLPLSGNGLQQNRDSLLIRKAPYMFGWDIMPRTVSAGLWKPVTVCYRPRCRIEDVFLQTIRLTPEKAQVRYDVRLALGEGTFRGLTLTVAGDCGDSHFERTLPVYNLHEGTTVDIDTPRMWWPRNYGEPNLYRVTVTLKRDGDTVDTRQMMFGVRTVVLDRTSLAGPDGKFRFVVNGKPLFLLGTNWVPTDAFPARQKDYDRRGLELAKDLNCNIIRCWGGNIYPDDALYDFCDENGIFVWQDFAMACGTYPQDEAFRRLMKAEAEQVVSRLRNHASLLIWSGDNECDTLWANDGMRYQSGKTDRFSPAENAITREVIPEVLGRLDSSRPYLPSSPYIDDTALKVYPQKTMAEEHAWGPRDFFKGDYYRNVPCHFASEIGYHGCPSPESMRKFLSPESMALLGTGKECGDREWLTHATCPDPRFESWFAYRIPLMEGHVKTLFGEMSVDWEDFALQSQISQAEAMKFFIEHFRCGKGYRSGMIWWNVIDGWPQISDAVVDWYGTKKLAYHYIKAAQQAFCLLCDEPGEDNVIPLIATNDSRETVTVTYTVTDALTGETVLAGDCTVEPDGIARIGSLTDKKGAYYIIDWQGSVTGRNHYTAAIGQKLDLGEYTRFLRASGYDEKLEGFAKRG